MAITDATQVAVTDATQMAITHLILCGFDWDEKRKTHFKTHFFLISETNAISVNLVVNERNCNS